MTKYEHKIIDADDLTRQRPSGNGTYGSHGWRVVAASTNSFGTKLILEREVEA